ncbi:interferon-induced transmembrane protein 1 isoform X4 [Mustela putorius furo]|uniref:Interferon-induced transmembrane protein 1 isoform X4 n=1 Tax=Mustela putorius furo TaxID=9669 RepID=A0A8U0UQB8_MUSPF|nr:interferon-induced transmembrane protein 1 isoform X4 [Mustela putorius furo]
MVKENTVDILGPPQSSAPVTTTVIDIRGETAVPDHIVWSLFNTIFLNWCCLGFVAFAYSVKSRDRKMVGDVIGAQTYASTAKCLNVCALVLGLLLTITFIILFVTGSLMIPQMVRQHGGY